ncbi:MAG TPA: LUD domain-containing protein [Thermoleophilaceae bacterium]
MSARAELLLAVRTALGPAVEAPEVPRDYRAAGSGAAAGSAELVDRFCERVADYKAKVHRVAEPDGLPEALAAACAERGSRRVVRAAAADWAIPGMEPAVDSVGLGPTDLDHVDAALTGCALAIAETGTIVLDGGPLSGRRALTLVPDHHICVVRADQVVASVPDAIAALADAARAASPLTFVSGPSATSDIELKRVEGVHGPRKLDVVLVG